VAPEDRENGLYAAQGEDIPHIFGHVNHEGYEKVDGRVSDEMMKCWVQFSKTGNPSIEGLPAWPKYTTDSNNYIILDDKVSTQIFDDDWSVTSK